MDPLGHLPRSKGKGNDRAAPLVGLALAFAAIIACARPSLAPGTPPGTGLIAKEIVGLRVSVEAEAWHRRPRDLAKRVMPFLLILRNAGAHTVTIARTDFLLLDDSNRQYLPLLVAEVKGFLYFQQPAPGFKNLRLVVVPRDLAGQPRLFFEFRPHAP